MHFNDPGLLPTTICLLQSSSSSTWKGKGGKELDTLLTDFLISL